MTNPDRVTNKKDKQRLGKNPLLTLLFTVLLLFTYYICPFVARKPVKISREGKTIKWATKLAIRRKSKAKRNKIEKKIEINSPIEKKVQMLADRHARKTINYIQRVENYVLSVGNLFLVRWLKAEIYTEWTKATNFVWL